MDGSSHVPPNQQHPSQSFDAQSNASYNSAPVIPPAMQSLQPSQYSMMQPQPTYNPQGVMQAIPQSIVNSMPSEQSHTGAPNQNNVQESPLIDFG